MFSVHCMFWWAPEKFRGHSNIIFELSTIYSEFPSSVWGSRAAGTAVWPLLTAFGRLPKARASRAPHVMPEAGQTKYSFQHVSGSKQLRKMQNNQDNSENTGASPGNFSRHKESCLIWKHTILYTFWSWKIQQHSCINLGHIQTCFWYVLHLRALFCMEIPHDLVLSEPVFHVCLFCKVIPSSKNANKSQQIIQY